MDAASLLRETEQFLHEQIPLTLAMGAMLERYDENLLVLTAPLAPNHNHLGTFFGGSLSALATLTGYALLWLELGDRNAHIVVRESSINYRHPVTRDARVITKRLNPAVLSDFKRKFEKTGKAKLSLDVTIEEDQRVCVTFSGVYVALAAP